MPNGHSTFWAYAPSSNLKLAKGDLAFLSTVGGRNELRADPVLSPEGLPILYGARHKANPSIHCRPTYARGVARILRVGTSRMRVQPVSREEAEPFLLTWTAAHRGARANDHGVGMTANPKGRLSGRSVPKKLIEALRKAGFRQVSEDQDGNIGFVSALPLRALTANTCRPLLIGLTEAGYRVGFADRGWIEGPGFQGLSLESVVKRADYLDERSQAQALSELVVASLHLPPGCLLDDFFARKGELRVLHRRSELLLQLTFAPLRGATLSLTLDREDLDSTKQVIPDIRTPQNWYEAVQIIQEQLDTLAVRRVT